MCITNLSVDLRPLERGKTKASISEVTEYAKKAIVGEPVVKELTVIGERRFYYDHTYWGALFSAVTFDSKNLKVVTQGLSTASIRALLLFTKRLKD